MFRHGKPGSDERAAAAAAAAALGSTALSPPLLPCPLPQLAVLAIAKQMKLLAAATAQHILIFPDVQHSIPISLEKSVGCPIFLTFSRFQNKLFAITDKGHFVSVGLLGVSPSATATPVVPAVLDLQLEEGDGYAKAISIPGTDVFLIATLQGRIIAVDTENSTPELLPYSASLGRGEIIGLTTLPGHNAAKRAVVIAYKDGTVCVFGLHEKSPLGTHAFIEEITTIEVTHQTESIGPACQNEELKYNFYVGLSSGDVMYLTVRVPRDIKMVKYARPCDEIARFDESKIVAGSSCAGAIQHIAALPGMFVCVSGGEPDLPQMIQVREHTKESIGTVLMTLPWVGNIIWMTGIAPSALLAAMEDGQILLYDVHPNASDHAPEALNPRLSAGGIRCITSDDEWPHRGIVTGAAVKDDSDNGSNKTLSLHGQSWPLPWCSYCERSIAANQGDKLSNHDVVLTGHESGVVSVWSAQVRGLSLMTQLFPPIVSEEEKDKEEEGEKADEPSGDASDQGAVELIEVCVPANICAIAYSGGIVDIYELDPNSSAQQQTVEFMCIDTETAETTSRSSKGQSTEGFQLQCRLTRVFNVTALKLSAKDYLLALGTAQGKLLVADLNDYSLDIKDKFARSAIVDLGFFYHNDNAFMGALSVGTSSVSPCLSLINNAGKGQVVGFLQPKHPSKGLSFDLLDTNGLIVLGTPRRPSTAKQTTPRQQEETDKGGAVAKSADDGDDDDERAKQEGAAEGDDESLAQPQASIPAKEEKAEDHQEHDDDGDEDPQPHSLPQAESGEQGKDGTQSRSETQPAEEADKEEKEMDVTDNAPLDAPEPTEPAADGELSPDCQSPTSQSETQAEGIQSGAPNSPVSISGVTTTLESKTSDSDAIDSSCDTPISPVIDPLSYSQDPDDDPATAGGANVAYVVFSCNDCVRTYNIDDAMKKGHSHTRAKSNFGEEVKAIRGINVKGRVGVLVCLSTSSSVTVYSLPSLEPLFRSLLRISAQASGLRAPIGDSSSVHISRQGRMTIATPGQGSIARVSLIQNDNRPFPFRLVDEDIFHALKAMRSALEKCPTFVETPHEKQSPSSKAEESDQSSKNSRGFLGKLKSKVNNALSSASSSLSSSQPESKSMPAEPLEVLLRERDLPSAAHAEPRPRAATAAIKPKAFVSSSALPKPSSSGRASSDRSELFQGASASSSSSGSRVTTEDEQASGIRSSQIRGHRSADEIKRAYGREPKAREASDIANQNKNMLMERGEKLQNLDEKTAQLQEDAMNFADIAKQLREQNEKKKWWQI